jgi:hypothetical protein
MLTMQSISTWQSCAGGMLRAVLVGRGLVMVMGQLLGHTIVGLNESCCR